VATAAARRYAKAVYELAERDGEVEEWGRRLAAIRGLMSDPEVASVLTNPTIATELRMALVSDAPHVLDPEGTNLAKLLIESNRVREVAAIEEEF
jgi:F-type H+-transporting ATPase subunit delta